MSTLMNCFFRSVFCGLVACLVGLTGPTAAETRAILVGVSDYDDSINLADLRGPANDVRLLQSVLADQGVTDMTLLADGVAGAERPTREAILTAFQNMANRAQAGDLVYVHLSGHGTRQADRGGDETDGLDEVFLPADTARAEPGSNAIPNAIVDDELGRAVNAIRATGADVWLVLDSCHSGSGLRSGGPRSASRFVDPASLGVDVDASRQTEAEIIESDGPEPPGGLLAFYAARSSEVAREIDFSAEGDKPAWYGLFSAKLAARLAEASGLSYRQLFQAVLSDMNDDGLPGGARLQTPLWEGNMIDAVVFGGRDTSGIRRFAVQGDEVMAGLVHGMGDGTVLGLVADAADDPDAIIGYAQMEDTEATRSFLRPVSADCVPQSTAPCPYDGALPDAARFAQLVARPVDLIVRIAPPRDLRTGDLMAANSAPMQALSDAIEAVNSANSTRVQLDNSSYEIESVWDGQELWFGPRAEIGGHPIGLNVTPEPEVLQAALTRIGRAEDLARLLGSVSGGGSLLNPNPVEITVDLVQVSAADLAPPDAGVSPRRECRAALGAVQGQSVALPPSADLKQCDQVDVVARGAVSGARDVNRIHIDARFCVNAAYEHIEDASATRRLGSTMTLCSDCPDGYSAGEERMFVIVTEAKPNAEALNLQGLVETCGPLGTATRSAAQEGVVDFLAKLSERPGTRGSFGSVGVDNIWVERFDWRVLPKPEALARAGLK